METIHLQRNYFVYIATNRYKRVLQLNYTDDLAICFQTQSNRTGKQNAFFTERYNCDYLLHYEQFNFAVDAIARLEELRNWSRKQKEELISTHNPNWTFLQLIQQTQDKQLC